MGLRKCPRGKHAAQSRIANGVFVSRSTASVTRAERRRPRILGHSFVADPFGVVLAEAGEGEETLVVDCDLSRQEWCAETGPSSAIEHRRLRRPHAALLGSEQQTMKKP